MDKFQLANACVFLSEEIERPIDDYKIPSSEVVKIDRSLDGLWKLFTRGVEFKNEELKMVKNEEGVAFFVGGWPKQFISWDKVPLELQSEEYRKENEEECWGISETKEVMKNLQESVINLLDTASTSDVSTVTPDESKPSITKPSIRLKKKLPKE